MKVADNQYLYRLETQNENGVSIDYIDVETVEPLRSVQDIHDEIDLENNKQIKRIEEIVFTGDSDEYWYNDDTHTTDTHFVAYIEGTNLFCNVDHPYCETDRAVFEFGDVHIDENKNFFCTSVELNGMNRIYISIDKSLLAYTVYSHETLKEYFKENPVTVWYVLRYPVEIPRIHAKGHVITHHDNTVIDVQPQTMGKVTPVVKATINDTQIEMDSVPTMTIDGTTEGSQITDLTFEGVTIVNNAKGDNVKGTKEPSYTRYDFAPFYDGQTVINNTIEGGYVSAKLYGDTIINIAKPYGETDLLTATEDGAIVDLLGENTDGVKLTDGTLTEGRVYGNSVTNIYDYNSFTNGSLSDTIYQTKKDCGEYLEISTAIQEGRTTTTYANWGTTNVQPLKPNTTYTVIIPKYDLRTVRSNIYNGDNQSTISPIYSNETKYVFTTSDVTINRIVVRLVFTLNDGESGKDIVIKVPKHIMVVEGDYFNTDVLDDKCFEGINSTINPNITIISHPFIFGKGGRL